MFVKLMVDGEKIGDKKKVDTTEETYRLLNPVVSKIDNGNKKKKTQEYSIRESSIITATLDQNLYCNCSIRSM